MAKMLISSYDIESMVHNCVLAILSESRHMLDDGVDKLARFIVNKCITTGGYQNRQIPISVLSKFLPERYMERMFGSPENFDNFPNLSIVFVDADTSDNEGSYSYTYNEIKIKKPIRTVTENTIVKIKRYVFIVLSHELSHFIDNNAQRRLVFTPDYGKNLPFIVKQYLYLFSPSEMQARLNQYGHELKYHAETPIQSKTLGLLNMQSMIDNLKAIEWQENGVGKYGRDSLSNPWVIVYLNFIEKLYLLQKKKYNNGDDYIYDYADNMVNTYPIENVKMLDKSTFYQVKNSIISKYYKRLVKLCKKANKIWNDFNKNKKGVTV